MMENLIQINGQFKQVMEIGVGEMEKFNIIKIKISMFQMAL